MNYKLYILLLAIIAPVMALSQTLTYDDFDGKRTLHYSSWTGTLDTVATNPAPDKVNPKGKCARYIRSKETKFDHIRMDIRGRLVDVSPYATYTGTPPKIRMKVYTNAPVGTLVELHLGSKARKGMYPEGTHSQFQAYITRPGTWEELEFKFSQTPKGSQTSAMQIDQVTLIFAPNSNNGDTYYFDELSGPPLSGDKPEMVVAPAEKVKPQAEKKITEKSEPQK